ncbi:MAG: hypothetical protein ACP5O2_03095 [Bacteroidales bacterium]
MARLRDGLKVMWVTFLSLLVVTSSGGILLTVHTCLSHNEKYIQLFNKTGHCEHSGSCCLLNSTVSCCSMEADGANETPQPEWVPVCCKDSVLQLSVGSFLTEQSADKILKWVSGYLLFEFNAFPKQVAFSTDISFPTGNINCKAPPLSHRPSVLCVFLI